MQPQGDNKTQPSQVPQQNVVIQPQQYVQPQGVQYAQQPQYVQQQPMQPQVVMQPQMYQPQQQMVAGGGGGVFVCEINPAHSGIQATEKCTFCNRMMCLQCTHVNSPVNAGWGGGGYGGGYGGYGGGYGYSAWFMRQKCCSNCSIKCDEVKGKYNGLLIFHIFMLILGSVGIIPCLLVGAIVGMIFTCNIPNDKFHWYIRRQNTQYWIIDLVMLIFYVIFIACFIPIMLI